MSIPALQTYLANISASNTLESNDVYVTDIFLHLLLNPDMLISSIQVTTLEGIANQCPIDGGDTVIRARHLLNVFDPEYYNPGVSCAGVQGLRTKEKIIEAEFTLNPNPNTGQFRIQIPKDWLDNNLDMEMYNSSGILLSNWKTRSRSLDLDLNLNPGIYYLKALVPNGVVVVKKLVINK